MAQVTINIGNADLPTIVSAFSAIYGYQANIPDPNNPGQTIPNPVTPQEFARQQIIRYVKDVTRQYLQEQSQAAAPAVAPTPAIT